VEMKVEDAFIASMKQQCGYVVGDASALRTVMDALRREHKLYEFAPVWFDNDKVASLSADLIRRKDRDDNALKAEKEMEGKQKAEWEVRVRRENGPRAQALKVRIHNLAKEAAEKTERRGVGAEHLFPGYSAWLSRRFADQWETTEITSDVGDFGVGQWNGRPLDGVIVKTTVKQRNRLLGAYDAACFFFGLVDDVEFSMQRDSFALECGNSERAITNWKVRRQFKSKWNWEPGD
jgi:hypothetical protein